MNLPPKEEIKNVAIGFLVTLGVILAVFSARANQHIGDVLGESTQEIETPVSAVVVERFKKEEEQPAPEIPQPVIQEAVVQQYVPPVYNPAPVQPAPQPTQPPVSAPPAEPVCNPTLQAVIERPYPYVYHLGDRAEQIKGSYTATCIESHEVSYEWYIWGSSKNIPQTLFSTSADPDFSAYEPNTYDVLLRVKARGLSSEVKTWVYVE
jgi:hypothetical protein